MIDFSQLSVGDKVVVEYTEGTWSKGGRLTGVITRLWDTPHLQAQVNDGWCFHEYDNILHHEKANTD